jgi:hypothetical protein
MKENCKDCRYTGAVWLLKGDTQHRVEDWCHMKGRIAPKNPCKWWRPKARKEERK